MFLFLLLCFGFLGGFVWALLGSLYVCTYDVVKEEEQGEVVELHCADSSLVESLGIVCSRRR